MKKPNLHQTTQAIHLCMLALVLLSPSIPNGFRAVLYASLLLIPFLFIRTAPTEHSSFKVWPVLAFLAIPTLYWVWQVYAVAPYPIISFKNKIPAVCAIYALFCYKYPPQLPLRAYQILLAISAFPALAWAIYQFVALHDRAQGAGFFSIHFGDMMALLSLITIYCSLKEQRSRCVKLLLILASFSYLSASLLSGTRGAWLAFMVLPLFALDKEIRKQVFTLGLVVVSCSLLIYSNNTLGIKDRILTAHHEISTYSTAEANLGSSSSGLRLEMWHFASALISERPFVGWNQKGYDEQRQIRIKNGSYSPHIQDFNHAHNDFLNEAAKGGILGLGTMLLLYMAPIIFFWQRYRRSPQDSEIRIFSAIGLLIPTCFAIFSLTESLFAWNSAVITAYFYLLIQFGAARRLP